MKNQDYIIIGSLKKPHGLKGELKAYVIEEFMEDFLQSKVFFIKSDGVLLPHFIADIREGNAIIISFEEVDTKEKADKIASNKIHIPTKDLIPKEERTWEPEGFVFQRCIGYTIKDDTLGEIGTIERLEEFPQQEMAFVNHNNKEVMIPLNDHFIKSIDDTAKLVLMDLPDGLV